MDFETCVSQLKFCKQKAKKWHVHLTMLTAQELGDLDPSQESTTTSFNMILFKHWHMYTQATIIKIMLKNVHGEGYQQLLFIPIFMLKMSV